MVSFNVYRSTTSGFYVEGVCLITDEKPVVGIANGSILYAVDTSSGETTRFMYDQSTMTWIEAECPCAGGSGGGGGSGSGGSGVAVCNITYDMDERKYTADLTARELIAAPIFFGAFDKAKGTGKDFAQGYGWWYLAKGAGGYVFRFSNPTEPTEEDLELVAPTLDDYPTFTHDGGDVS